MKTKNNKSVDLVRVFVSVIPKVMEEYAEVLLPSFTGPIGTSHGKYAVGRRERDGCWIIALDPDCEFHRDIGEKHGFKVKGGGFFNLSTLKDSVYLSGKSLEFRPDPDQRMSCRLVLLANCCGLKLTA